ncbi:MAG: dipeptidyl-peptidase-3, partial [Psychroserpens sp.]
MAINVYICDTTIKFIKMKLKQILVIAIITGFMFSCGTDKKGETGETEKVETTKDFDFNVEQFADIKVLRYQIPGWEDLTLKEQKLAYYLTQAGLSGR